MPGPGRRELRAGNSPDTERGAVAEGGREAGRKSPEPERGRAVKRPRSRWPGCGGESLGQRSALLPERI